MTKIAEAQNEAWFLFDEGRDGLPSVVLCGSIGMDGRQSILTKAEEQMFSDAGAAFLESLAPDISRKEHVHAYRNVDRSL